MNGYYGRTVSFEFDESTTKGYRREYGKLIDIVPLGDAVYGNIFAIIEMKDGRIAQPTIGCIRFEVDGEERK